ncbi:hypothetical protein A3Q37_05173 [Streptomyces sp. PTY087I2]|nr:hypothetical protein A3Q37_05173 [Streptomyces sp. PTY087I2]
MEVGDRGGVAAAEGGGDGLRGEGVAFVGGVEGPAEVVADLDGLRAATGGAAFGDLDGSSGVAQDESGCCPTLLAAPLDESQAVEPAKVFKALGDPVRLRLLSMIASREGGEICVCDLTPGRTACRIGELPVSAPVAARLSLVDRYLAV